jgi:hypothetical protein
MRQFLPIEIAPPHEADHRGTAAPVTASTPFGVDVLRPGRGDRPAPKRQAVGTVPTFLR